MSTAPLPENKLATLDGRQLAQRDGEWSVSQIIDQTRKIKECMNAVMIKDEHYGVIPGTKKPSLWKPGAEKLCLMFRFDPEYEILNKEETATFISFTVRCSLIHIPTGNRIASGLGSCNSREEKYRRPAPKLCPQCSKPAIIKGKEEYGGGWLCFKKKDGCGAKFKDGDQAIEGQSSGLADPSDLHNTILKMGCKRALIAAVLNGTAASDCFAQDLEDLPAQFLDTQEPRKPPAKPEPIDVTAGPPSDEAEYEAARRYEAMEDIGPALGVEEQLEASVMVDVTDQKTGEVTRQPKATRAQLAKAHILKQELHITDEVWQKRLNARFGVGSSALLCRRDIGVIIDEMDEKRKRREERAREALAEVGSAIGARTPGQEG